MRILGLDHGTTRIGVATSDETGVIASPVCHWKAEPFEEMLAELKRFIADRSVGLIVVGMPRNMDGTYGESAARVREWLRPGVPVFKKTDSTLRGNIAAELGALGVVTDVSSKASVDALADQTYSRFGRADIVFNNAGVAVGGPTIEMTHADWEWLMAVNLWGPIHGVEAFVPRMVEAAGSARNTRDRGHVLEGLAVALANIDEFIAIIRNAPTPPVAKAELMTRSWDSKLVREMLTRSRADGDRKSTRLNSSHVALSRMPSSA